MFIVVIIITIIIAVVTGGGIAITINIIAAIMLIITIIHFMATIAMNAILTPSDSGCWRAPGPMARTLDRRQRPRRSSVTQDPWSGRVCPWKSIDVRAEIRSRKAR